MVAKHAAQLNERVELHLVCHQFSAGHCRNALEVTLGLVQNRETSFFFFEIQYFSKSVSIFCRRATEYRQVSGSFVTSLLNRILVVRFFPQSVSNQREHVKCLRYILINVSFVHVKHLFSQDLSECNSNLKRNGSLSFGIS